MESGTVQVGVGRWRKLEVFERQMYAGGMAFPLKTPQFVSRSLAYCNIAEGINAAQVSLVHRYTPH